MSNRAASQGGALLRTSRMFSLPNKLPSPPGTNSSMAAAVFKSNTATEVFPTYQSVTTYPSSRLRGDWGFKRPLPLRSTTRSLTPIIRVKSIDSIERVTDFNSAADHSLTLEKWQEMGIPLTMPPQRTGDMITEARREAVEGPSVFEEDFDFTATDATTSNSKRWKFRGPWLAGMPEGTFQKYILKRVRHRRSEFKQYLRGVLATEMNAASRNANLDQGIHAEVLNLTAADITEEQLTDYIRLLREDRFRLYEHVGKFLDLAPLDSELAQMNFMPREGESQSLVYNHNPYAKSGPPITHPSAGMSYLRTSSYMTNHPVYGPQRKHPAIRANVLQPKIAAAGIFSPTIGVGGIVARVTMTDSELQKDSRNSIPGLTAIDPDAAQAPTVHMDPVWARVGSDGRIEVNVRHAQLPEIAVQKELRGEEKMFGEPLSTTDELLAQGPQRPVERLNGRPIPKARSIMGNLGAYGFGATTTA